MRPEILIVGQGLAGTLLAWEFERAGIEFAIVDQGHENAASSAAAGIVNPITGRRLVKSWRVDDLLPAARAMYRELEAALGVTLWREMRVRRLFADDRERMTFREKIDRGDLAPFIEAADDMGFWIRDAGRVDLAALLAAARARWQAMGRLRETVAVIATETLRHEMVVDCRGLAATTRGEFDFVPWEFSKGELIEIAVDGLVSDVVLNRRHWILPVAEDRAWVGATHELGMLDPRPSTTARGQLETSVREMLGADRFVAVVGHRAGIRVNLPDKHPIAGRHVEQPRLGIINALGAKGVLWAPMLARQWVKHLTEGVSFDPELDVRRFGRGGKA